MRKQIQDKNFVTIPGWVVNSLHITGDDAIVYSLILGYKDGFQEPLSYIAAWTSCEERKIQRILRRFVADGLVEELRASGKPTLYKCTDKMDTKGCLTDTPYTQKGCPTDTPTPVTRTPHIPQRGVPQTPHPCHTDTPHLIDIYNIYNNIISSSTESAHTRTCEEKEQKETVIDNRQRILNWEMDDTDGLKELLRRAGLTKGEKPPNEMREIVAPYVDEYYTQMQMEGKEDIERRGRQEVKHHFSYWLRKFVKLQQQSNINNNGTTNSRSYSPAGTGRTVPLDDIGLQIAKGFAAGQAARNSRQ